MKEKIFIVFAMAFCLNAHSQQRYKHKVFDSVMVTSDVVYGSNMNYKDTLETLIMDIYQPKNDTSGILRPVLVLAHGGSFVQGSRKSADMLTFCNEFAKRGFVVASVDYRVGIKLAGGGTIPQEYSNTVWRATHDMRAAVRFFRKDFANGNSYKINDTLIFAGGTSAGGVMALQLTYLDKLSKLQTTLVDTNVTGGGGIEGNSGNNAYSSKVKAVINWCGALSNVSWMLDNKNIPVCSVHGTNDVTVPHNSKVINFFGIDIMYMQGSYSIDSAAKQNGIYSELKLFYGLGHVPYSTNTFYMDTTVQFTADFLFSVLMGKTVLVKETAGKVDFSMYPNPAKDEVTVSSVTGFSKNRRIKIIDLNGKTLLETSSSTINTSALKSGLYFVEVRDGDTSGVKKLIIE